jgi:fumarylacetoacetate (FAA) hydrolase family protein
MNTITFPRGLLQCIGVAYTFHNSTRARAELASARLAHGSSEIPFSYFYKGNLNNLSGHGGDLCLRSDPSTGEVAVHSPEPELAMFLGEQHSIVGYCLANDLTATSLEGRSGRPAANSTYTAKVWMGCGSFGPAIVSAADIKTLDAVTIGMRILRGGLVVFDSVYSVSERNREFASIPTAIVDKYNSYGDDLPLAKRVIVDKDGFLPAGTLIMLGTGLEVSREYYCIVGDVLTVYSTALGELTNIIRGAANEGELNRGSWSVRA